MFCKECGKFISDDSKFCSYCGSRVGVTNKTQTFENLRNDVQSADEIEHREASGTISQAAENSVKGINLKRTAHFNWDLDGFPSDDKRREKEVSIDWQDILMSGDKRGDSSRMKRNVEDRKTDSLFFDTNADVNDKSLEKHYDTDLQSFLFEDKSNDEGFSDKSNVEHIGTGDSFAVNKFYTFNKKNEEFQRLLDKEYEKLKHDDGFEDIDDDEREFIPNDDSFSDAQKGGQESESDSPRFLEPSSNDDITGAEEDSDMGLLEDSNQAQESGKDEQISEENIESEGDTETKTAAEEDESIESDAGKTESEAESKPTEAEQSDDELKAKRNRRGRADNRSKTKFDFHAIFDDEDAVDSSNNVKQKKIHKKNDEAKETLMAPASEVNAEKDSDEDVIRPKSKGMKILSVIFYLVLVLSLIHI